MNHEVIIYIITSITLVSTFGLMLTRDNQEIVKKSLVINMAMSCLLVVVGEVLIFLLLALFNFFIFTLASVAALEEAEQVSPQEPMLDIPLVLIILVIAGMTIICVFQNVDFLNIDLLFAKDSLDTIKSGINFFSYSELVIVVAIVFLTGILFFNTRMPNK